MTFPFCSIPWTLALGSLFSAKPCPIPPSATAFPAPGVPRILHCQKLKIHPHLPCGICMQVFGGNKKDYLECVNLLELIETPCSVIAISLARRAPAAFPFYGDWDFLTDKSFKLEFSW